MISMNAFNRRTVGVVSVVVATVALAACDTNTPLEPQAPAVNVPAGPNAGIEAAKGALAWTAAMGGSTPLMFLAGAKFQVSGGGPTRTISDNDRSDSDPAIGRFTLDGLKPGTYTVCETVAPSGYAMPTPACVQMTVVANATAFNHFIHWQLPVMMVEFRNLQSNLVGGGTVTLKSGGPAGTVIKTVLDNGANDLNTTPGKFKVQLPAAGTYALCVTYAPPGYQFVVPYSVCQTATMQVGMGIGLNPYTVKPIGG